MPSPQIKSQQEYYDDFKTEIQARDSALTDFEDGSTNDTYDGIVSTAMRELTLIVSDKFAKTYIDGANGPEITGGPDDLQTLLVDHFGDAFARPGASDAVGDVTFTRPTAVAGAVLIDAGTIVKTGPNANGVAQRYTTLLPVTMGIGILTINASVEAIVPGSDGNADPTLVNIIETALTDNTIVVSNAAKFTGGAPQMDDADYRQFARNLIETIKGATIAAIEAAAKTVPGVELASTIEATKVVIEFNPATNLPVPGARFFRIPYPTLYIADANGGASNALLTQVRTAIKPVRACGVFINLAGATALLMNWSAQLTINPSGPNFATLSVDPTMIIDSMENYINLLPIGTGFVRATARAAILAIWGPAGTNDLTDFTNVTPVGDITATPTQKLKPNVVGVS